jgi:hypothetical protein
MKSKVRRNDILKRCVVVSPRHAFIRPWIRAYFATGNTTPLVIVPGPDGDWKDGDMAYCKAAAKFSGGLVFDCSKEWKASERLAERAVRKNVGWYSKKSILHAVATRLSPKTWAWIDDDAEVTGNLDECFDAAEMAPGFIFTQFYYPDSIDNRHPARFYRSNIDTGDKVCWNSLVFFHGEANKRLSEELGKDFPVEDDEIVFGYLYQHNVAWRDGFCDFSIRNWQANCKKISQIPRNWFGKLLHYTSNRNGGEIKKLWAAKADRLPKAPFEIKDSRKTKDKRIDSEVSSNDPVDAVFVIGTDSVGNNEELRYALRSLDRNCKFVRDVYICGFCPSWVDKGVVKHLQWPDRFRHAKDANIIDKLRHACEQSGIAKRILFCSDDQFQTRECAWDDFAPRYLRRYSSDDNWYALKKRVWHDRLRDTLEREVDRRKAIGLDTSKVYYFQPHIWMPIDRDKFIEYARWCGYERREDTIIASGYYNFAEAEGRPDFDHVFLTRDGKEIPGATHVAYHDPSFPAALRVMKSLFPDKCRFEMEVRDGAERKPSVTRVTLPSLPRATGKDTAQSNTSNEIQKYKAVNDDPSQASPVELSDILSVSARIRENPMWHSMLGEVSRAEELRLFGVRGWRTVWRDIIERWKSATCNGTDYVPVETRRSVESAKVVNAYMTDPESMRSVRFGPQTSQNLEMPIFPSRKLPKPASADVRRSLRDMVAQSLRRIG